jgi:hypothetical protein
LVVRTKINIDEINIDEPLSEREREEKKKKKF